MGTPLGPKYIPYTYMDPLGIQVVGGTLACAPSWGRKARTRVVRLKTVYMNHNLNS